MKIWKILIVVSLVISTFALVHSCSHSHKKYVVKDQRQSLDDLFLKKTQ